MLSNYDRRVRPNYGEKPTDVETSVYFLRGLNYDENKHLMTVECYYRQKWNDPRLAYKDSNFQITTDHELLDKIWQPDTFVANGEIENPEQHVFLKISPNGDVFKSVKPKITVSCPSAFTDFPMDVQTCSIEAESYGYQASEITYKFRPNGAIGYDKAMHFGNVRLVGIKSAETMVHLSTGNYSRIIISMYLARSPNRYVKYFYVPAILTFLVCWGIFWLPASSVLLRGFLGFMCLKCYLGLMQKGGESNPAGYMTRLDDYLITCAILALITLIESIWVHYLYRNRPGVGNVNSNDPEEADITEDQDATKPRTVNNETGFKKIGLYLDRGTKYALNIRHHRRGHEKVDIFCRILFPTFFALFNIIYWVVSYRKLNSVLEQIGFV